MLENIIERAMKIDIIELAIMNLPEGIPIYLPQFLHFMELEGEILNFLNRERPVLLQYGHDNFGIYLLLT